MLKSTRMCTALFCASVLLAAGAAAGEQPATDRHRDAGASHEQTRDGVTVRIEKIVRERVFNSVAWLRKQYGQDWPKEVPPDFTPEPFQVVRVFVSVTTNETAPGPIKKTGGSLKLGKKLSNGQSKWGPLISASFDPPLWQKELPDLKVDPEARGASFLKVVHRDTRIEDLSPAELRFQVTTSEGKEVEFLFSDLEF